MDTRIFDQTNKKETKSDLMAEAENRIQQISDDELDKIAGGTAASTPDWLQTIINVVGKNAQTVYDKGGCSAVKSWCNNELGEWNFCCQLAPC